MNNMAENGIKVSQIAKDLKVTSKDITERLASFGIEIKGLNGRKKLKDIFINPGPAILTSLKKSSFLYLGQTFFTFITSLNKRDPFR